MFRRLFSLAFAGALLATVASAEVRILKLEPTVLFANREPLQQIAWLEVENTESVPQTVAAIVTLDGKVQPEQRFTLPPGPSRQNLLVPDLSAETTLTVELRPSAGAAVRVAQPWQPQRKWKLFVVKSSHEDIGYENFLWVKQKEIADFIDLGRHLSAKTPAPVEEGARTPGGYHYWLETLLFPRYYAAERGEIALRELIERDVKPGNTPLGGAPSGVHLHWMDYEELVRTTYPGRLDYRDRFGLDLDTFAIVDNPSFSWSSAQVLAGAGFKYAVRFGQPFRTGGKNDYATTKLPAVFWWEGPDATSRVLFSWRNHYGINFWFGQTSGGYADLSELAAANVQREVGAVQDAGKLGPYPWDALLIPSYQDHEIPTWDNRALRRWQELYRYPEIRLADPRDFMVYMERTYGAQLSVLHGDLNNYSADYATIDPESQGWKRRAARELPLAESLAAIDGLADPAFTLPPGAVTGAYQRLSDYSEHSWPTSPPPQEVHQFNAQWGKRLEGRRALAATSQLLDRSMAALGAQVATGAAAELLVVNPLAHARSDLVFTTEKLPPLVDSVTGRPVATQALSTGETVFVAADVPALGYKTYRAAVAGEGATTAPTTLRVGANVLENEFYTVTFDPASGAITSIVDRQLGRELVDAAATEKFNQIVYVAKSAKESLRGKNYSPATGATLTPRTGPVAVEMIATFRDAALGDARVTQTVRLYAGVRRIDLINDLQHVGVLHTQRAADRYRHNLFYAFPLKVENFTARAEYAGGVVRPYEDQLRWGSHDYLAANRWVDVSNPTFGVTLAVHNTPIVHFGAIRYNEFANDYRPTTSHLYSFAWSNRMAGLFTLGPDEMNNRFEYSLTSHAGDWNGGATTLFGWSVASPLEARWLVPGQSGTWPAKSAGFANVDAPNVQLTVLKESERPGQGWIVRLVETEGRATEALLAVSRLPFDAAARCDLVENDVAPLAVEQGRVRVTLAPFGFATVRLYARSTPLPAVGSPAVTTMSDAALAVRWTAVPGARTYHVFRSIDPKAPPTTHTLVGRTNTTEYVDHGLALDTAYYYRVAAVAPGNIQGALSDQVMGQTARANTTAPSPVGDFDIVREAPDRLLVCWARSPEPDVARYYLYRGDRPDFDAGAVPPLAVVTPSGFSLEHYVDCGLQPGRTYHYRVYAEDWAGNRQARSATASGTTPKVSP